MQEDKREDRGIAECGPDSVSPHTLNRIQRLKSSPSCHQDEGCSMLRNLFEFVTNDTNGEMNSCCGGVSIIEKDSEDRLVRAFLAPPACCTTAKNFLLPQVVLDGTFSRGRRGGTFLTACMQDGNTETVVVSIAFVPSEAKEHWSWFCNNLKQALSLGCGKQPHSFQTEEQDLYLH